MNTTTNYGLKKPEDSDHYDIDDFNDNWDTLDTALDGLSFVRCTQAQYDAMATHDADTLYIIVG